jgi:HD-like signal output (HDOD) protein|tara:strand:+ start:3699 stop:4532 length:834 start_codon:yes stop_codon:yes gene_type:complete
MNEGQELIEKLKEKIEQDTLILPTLPAIAMQISDEASNPDADLKKMYSIIIKDPALSARMVKVANTSLIAKSQPVSGLDRAVNRLGLKNIKNIAIGLAMEQMFESNSTFTKSKMKKKWDQTVTTIGASIGVFNLIKEDLKKEFSADTLILAALLRNIGCLPIYKEASEFGDICYVNNFMEPAIEKYSGLIGGSILKKWGFEPFMVDVAMNVSDFSHFTDDLSYLDLIRIGMVACEQETQHRDIILHNAEKKGVSLSGVDFISDDYMNARDSALSIFN